MRVAATLLLLWSGAAEAAGPMRLVQADGVPSVESEVRESAPARCAADAVDVSAGVFGDGLGATLDEARSHALARCREQGGTACELGNASCDPDALTGGAGRD